MPPKFYAGHVTANIITFGVRVSAFRHQRMRSLQRTLIFDIHKAV